MISGTFVGGNAKVIIPLRDKKSIYKYCQEQKYDTSLPLSCDSSIGLKYTLSFIPKSNEQSNYFILLNLNEDLLKMFIEKEMTLDEIVCIVEESEKLDDYELFLCCLYYFHNYTNLENFEYALESFSCKIEDDEDYIELSEKGLCDEGILISFLYYYEGYSNDIVNEYTIALSTYFKKYPYHEFDSIIKDYYDINLSATDLCNYIDSFKFLRDKFNIVDFDDCWYLYHKTN